MDRFHAMTVFARVAEVGSFTKAAAALGLSRAAVSVAVSQLEAHLGARLLHRTTRQVHLTAEGATFFERCVKVLSELEESEQLFQKGPGRVSGKVSVDVPTRIARRVLVPALPEFVTRYPALEVRLGASDRNVNLLEKGVDAVVRVGPMPDSSLVAKALGVLAQVNCASPAYLARHGHPSTLADLHAHHVVGYNTALSGECAWEYQVNQETREQAMRCIVFVDNAETYVASCLAGLGLIQVPAYDVAHHLDSGALVAVLPQLVAPPLPLAIVYPNRRQVPQRVRIFLEWMATQFDRAHMLAPGSTQRLG